MKKIFENWNRYLKENEASLELWHNALSDAMSMLGEDIPLAEADVDVDIMPFKPEGESGFCIYNPQINDFAIQSPETFAETLLFVFGTMQTPWPKFVPYFRFMMDMVQNGHDLGSFTSTRTPREEKVALIRKTYLDANGLEEGKLTQDQEIYLDKAVSSVIMMVSTPKSATYNTIWENKETYYNTIAPLLASQTGGPEDLDSSKLLDLYTEVLKLPGLGKAKAGFTVQMLTGKLGCIDSIWSKIWNATDPQIAALIAQTLKGQAKGSEANIRKHALKYIDMLKAIKEGSGMGSKELWDAWTEQVAFQMRNPGRYTFDYTLRDESGDSILSGEGKYNYQPPLTKKGDPSQTHPYYSSYEGELGDLPDLEDLTLDVSKQHVPKNLKYIRESLTRVVKKTLKSRGIKIKR